MAEYSEAMSEISGYPKALSHAGAGGGGFTLKSVLFENTTENEVIIHHCITAEGKYIDPANDYPTLDDFVKISAGETVTVYYAEPANNSTWSMYAEFVESEDYIALNTDAAGLTAGGTQLTITAEAPDGATVAIEVYNSGDDPNS